MAKWLCLMQKCLNKEERERQFFREDENHPTTFYLLKREQS